VLRAQLHDASERLAEALEHARGETEQRAVILRAIFDSTHACLALLARDFTFLMVNATYVQNCGHIEEELLGHNHFELFPNEENQVIFARVRDTGEPYIANEKPFEYLDQPWRGVTYWKWILTPVHNAQGETESLLLSLTDVTPQVRARQQVEHLAEEAGRRAAVLDATFNAIADGVVIYGRQGEIQQMNPEFERLLNYTAADMSKPLSERMQLLQPEDAEGHPYQVEAIPMWRALRGETVRGEIVQITRRDGRRVCISVSGGPIRAEDGTTLGAVSTYTDISPQRELQEQQRIFLHMVSHDLRSPMAVINGHAALLVDMLSEVTETPPAMLYSLAAIQRGIRRMDVMIDDLVDAARLEGRQYRLNRQPVHLDAFFADLLDRSKTAFDAARIDLAFPPALPAVSADHDRLERIAINLLSNALKYSAPGTPINVSAEHRDATVVISVTDQGQGIMPEELPKLFQRFYRAANRKAEGIGLGLYITRLLVEAHGGRIWVDSQPGQGSTFAFSLPIDGQQR
jgi:PAS domain S-box-containing protein